MKARRVLLFAVLIGMTPRAFAQETPTLLYSDIDSGPSAGGEGGVDGAFLCIYGEHFGTSPVLTIGGVEVATYKVISDPGKPYLPGHFAKVCGQISHLTPSGRQDIIIATGDGSSNALAFISRPGHVYFAAASGSDRNSGSSSAPFATLKACKNALAPGDICYVHALRITALDNYGAVLWLGKGGVANAPIVLSAYPGEKVEIDGSPAQANGIVNYVANGAGYVGYFTIAGFKVNGFSSAFNGKPGSHIRFVDNEITCTGANCSNLAAGFVATGGAAQSLDHAAIYGNRFHDIGCSDPNTSAQYFNYALAVHPCAWINAGTITASSSRNVLTLSGVPVGWSIPDVIRVSNPGNGQTQIRRPAASATQPCIEGKNGTFPNCSTRSTAGYVVTLDQPFSPDLPAGTKWQFRMYSPAKTEHNIYFGAWTYYLDFAWNEVNGNGLACRGLQIFHDAGPQNNHDLYIHDNYIHHTVCDGINLNAFDPTWGPVQVFNNLIVNAGEGISDIIADSVGGGGNNSAIYMSGAGANPYINHGVSCTGASCFPDQLQVFSNTIVNCGITGAAAMMQWPKAVGCITRSYDFFDPRTQLILTNNIFVQPVGGASPYYAAYQPLAANTHAEGNLCSGIGPCPATFLYSLTGDPQFVGPTANDFRPMPSSPARSASISTPIAGHDADGRARVGAPYTVGAYEVSQP